MEKSDIALIAQLLTSMKDAADKLEIAYNRNDVEDLSIAKREILRFQMEIDKIL